MGSETVECVGHGATQVLVQRRLGPRLVIKGHRLIEHTAIASFLHVGGGRQNEPQGIVVEPASYVVIAALGQRLVLMVGAAIGKLRGRQIDEPFPGAVGDHVNGAQQILTGITKPDSAPDASFKIGGGAGDVECDYVLIGVP